MRRRHTPRRPGLAACARCGRDGAAVPSLVGGLYLCGPCDAFLRVGPPATWGDDEVTGFVPDAPGSVFGTVPCEDCDGEAAPAADTAVTKRPCGACDGTGWMECECEHGCDIEHECRECDGRGHFIGPKPGLCEECGGAGRVARRFDPNGYRWQRATTGEVLS